jgi:hypothetical protein
VAAVLLAVMKLVSRQVKQRSDRTTDWLRRHLKSDRESIPFSYRCKYVFGRKLNPFRWNYLFLTHASAIH